MDDTPSSPAQRALSDGEAEYNASCLIRRAGKDMAQLHSAVGQIATHGASECADEFYDVEWGNVATVCTDMSSKQDNATNTANDLTRGTSKALAEIRGDQTQMQPVLLEARKFSEVQKEGQWRNVAQSCREMSLNQGDTSNTSDALVRLIHGFGRDQIRTVTVAKCNSGSSGIGREPKFGHAGDV